MENQISNGVKKPTIIIIVVAVAILIIGVALLVAKNSIKKNAGEANQNNAPTGAQQLKEGETATKLIVPENIKVPGVGEKTESGVAAPSLVAAAAPGVTAQFRSFNINGEKGGFNPSTVIVNLGDTVHVNFVAVDKDYDITFPDYGMKQTAKKGESKILEFQAVATGKFLYYCEQCGGMNSTAKGYIIVAGK